MHISYTAVQTTVLVCSFPVQLNSRPPFPLSSQNSDDDSDGHERHTAAAAAAGSGARMKELLASYYGMQQQQRTGEDMSSDVDSTYFDAKRYVAGLLRNDKIETLLRKDDEMVSAGVRGITLVVAGRKRKDRRGEGRCVFLPSLLELLRGSFDWRRSNFTEGGLVQNE